MSSSLGLPDLNPDVLAAIFQWVEPVDRGSLAAVSPVFADVILTTNRLPILITESTRLILPAGLKVQVFLVGGGGAGNYGGGGSGHLAEAVVQVPPSGQLAVTIGRGGDTMVMIVMEGKDLGLKAMSGGDTTVQCAGARITAAGGEGGSLDRGGAGWSGGGAVTGGFSHNPVMCGVRCGNGGSNGEDGEASSCSNRGGGPGSGVKLPVIRDLHVWPGSGGRGGGGVATRGAPVRLNDFDGEGFGAGGGGEGICGFQAGRGNSGCVVLHI